MGKARPMKVLLLSLFLTQCAKSEPAEPSALDLSALRVKYETYSQLSTKFQGANGFIDDTDCDSLLFSSLYSFTGSQVEILAAQGESGYWYRTPGHDCYPDRSKSSISRDMLLGLLFHALRHKDGTIAENLIDYGRHHAWVMGEGPTSRTWLNPSFRKTLALLGKSLTGSNHYDLLIIPDIWTPGLSGFQAHLAILHLTLRDLIQGKIDETGKGVVGEQYRRNPGNALFSYLYHRYSDGDQTRTLKILMDETLFPNDRLPTSAERCEPYLWQRDEPYSPCDEFKEHPGIDFLFVARLLIDALH